MDGFDLEQTIFKILAADILSGLIIIQTDWYSNQIDPLVTFENSFDPDQDQHLVVYVLGSNYFILWSHLKRIIASRSHLTIENSFDPAQAQQHSVLCFQPIYAPNGISYPYH